ncbi:MAG: leucine-rich repeat protein, partial [Ruminococcus sp.]|nr:leucine-rich repeat protein [Ruminococcus sp.]
TLKTIVVTGGPRIPHNAFEGMTSLTEVVLPDTITTIENNAFSGCTGLETIKFPKTITSIDSTALYQAKVKNVYFYNNNLTIPAVPEGATIYGYSSSTAKEYADKNGYKFVPLDSGSTTGTTTVTKQTTTTNTLTTTTTSSKTSTSTSKATSTTSQSATTSVTTSVSTDTGLVQMVMLGDGITAKVLDDGTLNISGEGQMYDSQSSPFKEPESIKNVQFQGNITSIGDNTFAGMSTLSSIVIPETVKSVGEDAFSDCKELVDVGYEGSESEWKDVSVGKGNEAALEKVHFNEKPQEIIVLIVLTGDSNCDGRISKADGMLLARYIAGWEGITLDVDSADINKDGQISKADGMILSRYIAGWEGYDKYFQ